MLTSTLAGPSHLPALERHPPFPAPAQALAFDPLADDDDGEPNAWTDEDIVYLHWRMLKEVEDLADPEQPLADKFDTLRWIFSDPDKDAEPFSFANCVRVVACNRLSPIPYCGQVDVEEVRDCIRVKLRRWLAASLERYPDWVRQAVVTRPEWVHERLARNPQWINEQLKRIKDQGDLFG
ncbi:hypothetical protein LDO26_00805 [Luteimonas sp. BDR2-5]|uniref:hypothetical protein n=1 Tax=Proluteimonas luteida TaxID=2878685 RepID=UPI001E2D1B7F|nr:hypothetical protein [Luteimonas sp. BDR2-5]MCD9026754.1 hypothetical protein [Luteimonas sp. BDR2-5]